VSSSSCALSTVSTTLTCLCVPLFAAGEGLVTEADIPSLKRHPQAQKSPEASAHLRFVFRFRFRFVYSLDCDYAAELHDRLDVVRSEDRRVPHRAFALSPPGKQHQNKPLTSQITHADRLKRGPFRFAQAWGLNKNVVVHLVLVHDHLVGEEERFSYFDYDTIKKEVHTSGTLACTSKATLY
jgi:hypothetical protein